MSDLKERAYWDQYQEAYGEAISATSTDTAPWFVIPADDKWYARLAIASVIYHQFNKLELGYPVVSEAQKTELQKAKIQLMGEKDDKKKKSKIAQLQPILQENGKPTGKGAKKR